MNKITLFVTSDLHGSIMPYSYADNQEKAMGMAKISQYIHTHKDENTIVIDNGDVLEGNALLDYCYLNNLSPVSSKALQLMGVNYINLGNHDFNYGEKVLLTHLSKFNCLSGNVRYHDKRIGNRVTIHEFANGKKMALIGAVTHFVNVWEKPDHIRNFKISDAFDFISQAVDYAKNSCKVDYVTVVYHGGFECDLQTGVPIEKLTGENQGYRILNEIKGIDILITGHQHRSIAQVINGVAITQTAFMGKELASIVIDDNGIHPSLITPQCCCDINMCNEFKNLEAKVQQWLDQPIGKLAYDLLINDGFKARLTKHPLVSFFNQVTMEVSHAQLASNALFNDAKGFNATITMRDLVSSYMYPNTIVVLKVSGQILKEYLEQCANYFTIKDGQICVSPSYIEPKPQHYNYDMVDGICYTIKVSNPIGKRIIDLTYEGKQVLDTDTFTLALNNYRAAGGGNFDMFKNCEVVKEINESMVTLLSEYIMHHQPLQIHHRNNIEVIY